MKGVPSLCHFLTKLQASAKKSHTHTPWELWLRIVSVLSSTIFARLFWVQERETHSNKLCGLDSLPKRSCWHTTLPDLSFTAASWSRYRLIPVLQNQENETSVGQWQSRGHTAGLPKPWLTGGLWFLAFVAIVAKVLGEPGLFLIGCYAQE